LPHASTVTRRARTIARVGLGDRHPAGVFDRRIWSNCRSKSMFADDDTSAIVASTGFAIRAEEFVELCRQVATRERPLPHPSHLAIQHRSGWPSVGTVASRWSGDFPARRVFAHGGVVFIRGAIGDDAIDCPA